MLSMLLSRCHIAITIGVAIIGVDIVVVTGVIIAVIVIGVVVVIRCPAAR